MQIGQLATYTHTYINPQKLYTSTRNHPKIKKTFPISLHTYTGNIIRIHENSRISFIPSRISDGQG